jgi:hypothetical protein
MIPSFLLAVAVQIGWKSKRFTATLKKSKPFHKPRFSHQKGAFGVRTLVLCYCFMIIIISGLLNNYYQLGEE